MDPSGNGATAHKSTRTWPRHVTGLVYFSITVIVLCIGYFGPYFAEFDGRLAFMGAIGLCVMQFLHFAIMERSLTTFPVQVRIAILLFFLSIFPAPLNFLYIIPIVGMTAEVVFDYCLMARVVSLFPWNRNKPFTLKLFMKTIFSAPVKNIKTSMNDAEISDEAAGGEPASATR